MKYLIILFLSFAFVGNAQNKIDLSTYGINASVNSNGLELYNVDSTLKSPDAQKILSLEFDGLRKVIILQLKKGKLATKELATINAQLKQKKLKIAYQEKNALISEQKGTYKVFVAREVNGKQYFIQTNLCSTIEKAKELLEIAKSLE